jgi:hypothetical protein
MKELIMGRRIIFILAIQTIIPVSKYKRAIIKKLAYVLLIHTPKASESAALAKMIKNKKTVVTINPAIKFATIPESFSTAFNFTDSILVSAYSFIVLAILLFWQMFFPSQLVLIETKNPFSLR